MPCGVWAVRATRAEAMRGVRGAPAARGRGGRAAQSAADRQKARPVHSKEPQWDIQDYRKGEGRFASVAKQFPKEADELFLAARARLFRCRSGERSVALQELPQNAGHSMVIKESARICAGITKMYPLSLL